MKYFTPQLFVKGNSSDEDLVDQAEAEWEQAGERYEKHYRSIEPDLPEELRRFHEEQCLHDADVLGPVAFPPEGVEEVGGGQRAVLVAQQANTLIPEFLNTLITLQYALADELSVEVPVRSDVFHTTQPIWLYEELDVVRPGVFVHEILISDGRVVRITFRDFRYHLVPLIPVGPAISAAPRRLSPAPGGG